MNRRFACLIIVGLAWGVSSVAAEDHDAQLPFTRRIAPADALQPENVAVVASDPSEIQSWVGRKVFLKLGAVVKPADEWLRKEQVTYPASVTDVDGEWLKLGRLWARRADVMTAQEAMDYFTERLRLNPADAVSVLRRGEVHHSRGNFAAALADYRQAIENDPWHALAHRNRGAVLIQQGDDAGAILEYDEAIRIDPNLAMAFYSRGNARRYLGEIDAAIRDYTEAIRLDPGMADVWNNRGVVRKRAGDCYAAVRDFTEAIRLDPTMSKACFNRGMLLNETGDYAAAIRDFTQALRWGPKEARVYYQRGLAWHFQGDLETAVRNYSQAIWLEPSLAAAYANRGIIRRSKGDLNIAIRDFDRAIHFAPTNPSHYVDRGIVFNMKRDFDAALCDFTRALELDPDNVEACNHMAWLFATRPEPWRRDGKRAVELGMKACRLSNWKDWRAVDTLAAALAESGSWDEAVMRQEQAVAMADDESKARTQKRLELYRSKLRNRDWEESAMTGATLSDDQLRDDPLSAWVDDTEDFNRQTAAIVNGGRILNGEVLDRHSRSLLTKRRRIQQQQRPHSEYDEYRESLVQNDVAGVVQRRLLIDAFESSQSVDRLVKIHAFLDEMFKKEIERLKGEMKVATENELVSKLDEVGASLESIRRQFVNEQMAGGYFHLQTQQLVESSSPDKRGNSLVHVEWEQIQVSFENETSRATALDKIRQAQQCLEDGAAGFDVARWHSDGPTAETGGKQEWMDVRSLKDAELAKMLLELPIGTWSTIHEGPGAFQLVRVLGRRVGEHFTLVDLEESQRQTPGQDPAKERAAQILLGRLISKATIEIATATGQENLLERGSWLNKKVFLKLNAEWKPADPTARRESIPFPAKVEQVDFETLKVGRIWVHENDVMELPEALDYFTDMIRANPNDAACWVGRGDVWQRKGYADKAIADYTEAIRLDPNLAVAYCSRGTVATLQRRYRAAMDDLDEAIHLRPEYALALLYGGILHRKYRLNEFAAYADLSSAIEIDPGFAEAYLTRGFLPRRAGELDAAIQNHTKGLQLDPDARWAYVDRGFAWQKKGDFAAAIQDYNEAIRLGPEDDAGAYCLLAWALATCPDPKL